MEISLEGIFVPHITPFRKDGQLDEEALRECVHFWLQSGLSGLVPCGSNGEAPYLSPEEKRTVIKIVVEEANGKVPVIAGTGEISTQGTIQLTKDAKDIGVDAALVVSPYFFKYSSRELYEHYSSVLETIDLPIVIYNVPKFTGISLEPSLVYELASEYENVIGIKDSSGSLSQITELIRLVGDKISVLAGTGDVVLPTLMLGGKGAVIGVANVAPKICMDLYKAFRGGKFEEASRLQKQITYINEVLLKKYNQLSAIKAALNMLGLPAGYPRKPTSEIGEEPKEEINRVTKLLDMPQR